MFKLSKRSLSRMEGVHPELILVFKKAIEVSPIDFGIPGDGGVRTAERQNEMFLDPGIITHCDGFDEISNHQIAEGEEFGRALDFYAYVRGRASWNKNHLAMVAAVILSTNRRLLMDGEITIKLKWGGTFGSFTFEGWDYPHIEIA